MMVTIPIKCRTTSVWRLLLLSFPSFVLMTTWRLRQWPPYPPLPPHYLATFRRQSCPSSLQQERRLVMMKTKMMRRKGGRGRGTGSCAPAPRLTHSSLCVQSSESLSMKKEGEERKREKVVTCCVEERGRSEGRTPATPSAF